MAKAARQQQTAIYLRISEDRTGLELGVQRQRDLCTKLAKQRDWFDVVYYQDNDISAFSGKRRPEYEAMMAAVTRGDVARVIAYDMTRLWRSVRQQADAIEKLRTAKVAVSFVNGGDMDLTSSQGRMYAGVIGNVAEFESAVKSERVKAELHQRAQRGVAPTGPRLYGYTVDGMALHPDEAGQVESWYRDIVAGVSLMSIADGAGITPACLRDRLRNPRYCGVRVLDGVEHPGNWPAIVDQYTWRSAVSILDGRRRGNARTRKLGSGLFLCDRCQRTVMSGGLDGGIRTYKCLNRLGGCGRQWRADPVDAYVDKLVRARLGRADLATLLPQQGPDSGQLATEAQAIRTRLRKLATDYLLLGLDEAAVQQATAAAKARLLEIEAITGSSSRTGALEALAVASDPVKAYSAITDVFQRQAAIRSLMTVSLTAPPRGRWPWNLGQEQLDAWYVGKCVDPRWHGKSAS